MTRTCFAGRFSIHRQVFTRMNEVDVRSGVGVTAAKDCQFSISSYKY